MLNIKKKKLRIKKVYSIIIENKNNKAKAKLIGIIVKEENNNLNPNINRKLLSRKILVIFL